ncbi:hypothetical protein ACTXT7_006690 [Hymenolepis weldensis]
MPEKWNDMESIPTSLLSDIARDPDYLFYNTERIIREHFNVTEYTDEDLQIIHHVGVAVANRAALYAGTGVACLVNRIKRREVTVGVDGSLFKLHPNFPANMLNVIRRLANPLFHCKLQMSEDGSGKGAGALDDPKGGASREANSANPRRRTRRTFPHQSSQNNQEEGRINSLTSGSVRGNSLSVLHSRNMSSEGNTRRHLSSNGTHRHQEQSENIPQSSDRGNLAEILFSLRSGGISSYQRRNQSLSDFEANNLFEQIREIKKRISEATAELTPTLYPMATRDVLTAVSLGQYEAAQHLSSPTNTPAENPHNTCSCCDGVLSYLAHLISMDPSFERPRWSELRSILKEHNPVEQTPNSLDVKRALNELVSVSANLTVTTVPIAEIQEMEKRLQAADAEVAHTNEQIQSLQKLLDDLHSESSWRKRSVSENLSAASMKTSSIVRWLDLATSDPISDSESEFKRQTGDSSRHGSDRDQADLRSKISALIADKENELADLRRGAVKWASKHTLIRNKQAEIEELSAVLSNELAQSPDVSEVDTITESAKLKQGNVEDLIDQIESLRNDITVFTQSFEPSIAQQVIPNLEALSNALASAFAHLRPLEEKDAVAKTAAQMDYLRHQQIEGGLTATENKELQKVVDEIIASYLTCTGSPCHILLKEVFDSLNNALSDKNIQIKELKRSVKTLEREADYNKEAIHVLCESRLNMLEQVAELTGGEECKDDFADFVSKLRVNGNFDEHLKGLNKCSDVLGERLRDWASRRQETNEALLKQKDEEIASLFVRLEEEQALIKSHLEESKALHDQMEQLKGSMPSKSKKLKSKSGKSGKTQQQQEIETEVAPLLQSFEEPVQLTPTILLNRAPSIESDDFEPFTRALGNTEVTESTSDLQSKLNEQAALINQLETRLCAQNEEFQSKLAEANEKNSQFNAIQSSYEIDIQRLKSFLRQKTSDVSELIVKLNSSKQTISTLNDQIAELKAEVSTVRGELSAVQKESVEQSLEVERIQGLMHDKNQEMNDFREVLAGHEAQIQNLRFVLNNKDADLMQKDKQIEILLDNLSNSTHEAEKLRHDFDHLNSIFGRLWKSTLLVDDSLDYKDPLPPIRNEPMHVLKTSSAVDQFLGLFLSKEPGTEIGDLQACIRVYKSFRLTESTHNGDAEEQSSVSVVREDPDLPWNPCCVTAVSAISTLLEDGKIFNVLRDLAYSESCRVRLANLLSNAEAQVSDLSGMLASLKLEVERNHTQLAERTRQLILLGTDPDDPSSGRADSEPSSPAIILEKAIEVKQSVMEDSALKQYAEDLQIQLQNAQQNIIALEKRCEDAESATAEAMQKLAQVEEQIAFRASEDASLPAQNIRALADLLSTEPNVKLIMEKIESLQEELLDNLAEKGRLQQQLHKVRDQLEKLNMGLGNHSVAKFSEIEEHLTSVLVEKSSLEGQLNEQRDKIDRMTSDIDNLEAERSQLSSQLDKTGAALKSKDSEIELLNQKLHLLEVENKQKLSECASLQANVEDLTKQLGDAKSAAVSLAPAVELTMVEPIQAEPLLTSMLHKESPGITETHHEFTVESGANVDDIMNRLSSLAEQVSPVRGDEPRSWLSLLEQAESGVSSLLKDHADLKQKVSSLETERNEFQNELETQNALLSELERVSHSKEIQVARLARVEREKRALEDRLHEAQAETSEFGELQKHLETLTSALSAKSAECAILYGRVNQLSQELTEAGTVLTDLIQPTTVETVRTEPLLSASDVDASGDKGLIVSRLAALVDQLSPGSISEPMTWSDLIDKIESDVSSLLRDSADLKQRLIALESEKEDFKMTCNQMLEARFAEALGAQRRAEGVTRRKDEELKALEERLQQSFTESSNRAEEIEELRQRIQVLEGEISAKSNEIDLFNQKVKKATEPNIIGPVKNKLVSASAPSDNDKLLTQIIELEELRLKSEEQKSQLQESLRASSEAEADLKAILKGRECEINTLEDALKVKDSELMTAELRLQRETAALQETIIQKTAECRSLTAKVESLTKKLIDVESNRPVSEPTFIESVSSALLLTAEPLVKSQKKPRVVDAWHEYAGDTLSLNDVNEDLLIARLCSLTGRISTTSYPQTEEQKSWLDLMDIADSGVTGLLKDQVDLKQHIGNLESKSSELKQELETKETKVQKLEDELLRRDANLYDLEGRMEEILTRLLSQINSLTETANSSESRVTELSSMLENSRIKVNELRTELDSKSDRESHLRSELDKLTAENADLLSKCGQMTETLNERSAKLAQIEDSLKTNEQEDRASQLMVAEEIYKNLESALTLKDQEVKSLKEALKLKENSQTVLEDSLKVKEEEVKSLMEKLHEAEILAEELDALKQNLQVIEEEKAMKTLECVTLTEEIATLNQKVSTAEARETVLMSLSPVTEQAADLQQEIIELNQENEAKTAHIAQLESEMTSLNAKLENLRGKYDNKAVECEHLSATVVDLAQQLDAAQSKTPLMEAIEAIPVAAEQPLASAPLDVAGKRDHSFQKLNEEQATHIVQIEDEKKQLEGTLNAKEVEIKSLKDQIFHMLDFERALKSKTSESFELEEMRRRLMDLEAENDHKSSEILHLKQELVDRDSGLQNLEALIIDLNQRLHSQMTNIDSILSAGENRQTDLLSTLEDLRAEVVDKAERNCQLLSEFEQERSELSKALEEKAKIQESLEDFVKELQEKLKQSPQKSDDNTSELAELLQKIKDLEEEIAKKDEDLEATDGFLEDQIARIAELEEANVKLNESFLLKEGEFKLLEKRLGETEGESKVDSLQWRIHELTEALKAKESEIDTLTNQSNAIQVEEPALIQPVDTSLLLNSAPPLSSNIANENVVNEGVLTACLLNLIKQISNSADVHTQLHNSWIDMMGQVETGISHLLKDQADLKASLGSVESEKKVLTEMLEAGKTHLQELSQQISEQQAELVQRDEKLRQLEKEIKEISSRLAITKDSSDLTAMLEDYDQRKTEMRNELDELRARESKLLLDLEDQLTKENILTARLTEKEAEIQALKTPTSEIETVELLKNELEFLRQENEQKSQTLANLTSELEIHKARGSVLLSMAPAETSQPNESAELRIAELEKALELKQSELNALQNQLIETKQMLEEILTSKENYQNALIQLENDLKTKEDDLNQMTAVTKSQALEFESLNGRLHELEEVNRQKSDEIEQLMQQLKQTKAHVSGIPVIDPTFIQPVDTEPVLTSTHPDHSSPVDDSLLVARISSLLQQMSDPVDSQREVRRTWSELMDQAGSDISRLMRSLEDLKTKISTLESYLDKKDVLVKNLYRELSVRDNSLHVLETSMIELSIRLSHNLSSLADTVSIGEDKIPELMSLVEDLSTKKDQLEVLLAKLEIDRKDLKDKLKTIEIQAKIEPSSEQSCTLEEQLQSLQTEIAEKDEHLKSMESKLQQAILEYSKESDSFLAETEELHQQLQILQKINEQKSFECSALQDQVDNLTKELEVAMARQAVLISISETIPESKDFSVKKDHDVVLELKQKNEEQASLISSLEDTLKAKTDDDLVLRQKLQTLEENIVQKENECSRLFAEVSDLIQQLAQARTPAMETVESGLILPVSVEVPLSTASAESSSKVEDTELFELLRKNEEQGIRIAEIEIEKRQLEESLNSKHFEINTLKDKLSHLSDLEVTNLQLNAEIAALKDTAGSSAELEGMRICLKGKDEDIQHLTNEVCELQRELTERDATLQNLEASMMQLHSKLILHLSGLESTLSSRETELSVKAENENQLLEELSKALESKEKVLKSLQGEKELLEVKLQQSPDLSTLEVLQEKIHSLEDENTRKAVEYKSLLNEVDDLTVELNAVKAREAVLLSTVEPNVRDSLKEESDFYTMTPSTSEVNEIPIDELLQEVHAVRFENEELLSRITEIESLPKSKEEELAKATENADSFTKEIEEIRQRVKALEEEKELTIAELRDVSKELQAAKSGKSLTLDEAAIHAGESELKSKIMELEAMIRSKEAESKSLEEEISKLSQNANASAFVAEELRQKLREMEEAHAQKIAECERLMKELNSAKTREMESQSMTPIIESVKSEILASAPPLEEETVEQNLATEVNLLKRENEALMAHLVELESSLKHKEDRISAMYEETSKISFDSEVEIQVLREKLDALQHEMQQKVAECSSLAQELETTRKSWESDLLSAGIDGLRKADQEKTVLINNLESNLRSKDVELQTLEERLNQLIGERDDLQEKLQLTDDQQLSNVVEVEKLKSDAKKARDDLRKRDRDLQNLESSLADLLNRLIIQLNDLEGTMNSGESRIFELLSLIDEYEVKKGLLKQELNALREKFSKTSGNSQIEVLDLQKRLDNLQDALDQKVADNSLKRELETTKVRESILMSHTPDEAELKAKIAVLEATLKVKGDEIRTTQASNEELHKKLKELENLNDKKTADFERMKEDLEAMKINKIPSTEPTTVESVKPELLALAPLKVTPEIESIRQENETLLARVSNLESTLKSKEDELDTLRNEADKFSRDSEMKEFDLCNQLKALQVAIGEKEVQCFTLNQELQEAKARESVLISLTPDEAAAQVDKAQLKSQIVDLEANLRRREEELKMLEGEIPKLSKNVNDSALETEELRKKLREMEDAHDLKIAECERLMEELNSTKAREMELQSMTPVIESTLVEPLKSEFLASAPPMPEFTAEIESLRQENSALTSHITELETNLKDKEDEIKNLSEEVRSIEQQLEQKTADIGALNRKLETAKARESVLISLTPDEEVIQTSEAKLKHKIAELEEALQSKDAGIKSLVEEMSIVYQNANMSASKAEELKQKLKDMEETRAQKVEECERLLKELDAAKAVAPVVEPSVVHPVKSELLGASAPPSEEQTMVSEEFDSLRLENAALSSRVTDLQSEITILREEVSKISYESEVENQSLCQKLGNLQVEFEVNKSAPSKHSTVVNDKEIEALKMELNDMKYALSCKVSDCLALSTEIRQLKEEFGAVNSHERDLQNLESSMNDLSSRLQVQMKDFALTIDSGESRISDLLSMIKVLELNERQLRNELDDKEREIRGLRKEASEMHTSNNAEVLALREKINTILGALDQKVIECTSLTHELETAKARESLLMSLTPDESAIQAGETELKSQAAQLQARLAKKENEVKTMEEDMRDKISCLSQGIEASTAEAEQLRQQLKEMEDFNAQKIAECGRLIKELEAVKSKEPVVPTIEPTVVEQVKSGLLTSATPQTETDNQVLTSRIAELEAIIQDKDDELEGLREEIEHNLIAEDLRQQLARLREQFGKQEVECNSLKQELESMKAASMQITVSSVEVEALRKMLEEKELQIQKLGEENISETAECKRLCSEVKQLKKHEKDVNDIESNISDLSTRLLSLLNILVETIDSGEIRVRDLMSLVEDLKRRESEIKKELDEERKKIAQDSAGLADLEVLKNKLNEKEFHIRDKEEELKNLREQSSNNANNLEVEIRELHQQLETLKATAEQRSAEFNALDQKLQAAKARESLLISLTPDEAAIQASETELRSKIADLEASLRSKEDEIKDLEDRTQEEILKLSQNAGKSAAEAEELQGRLLEMEKANAQKVVECERLMEELNSTKAREMELQSMTPVIESTLVEPLKSEFLASAPPMPEFTAEIESLRQENSALTSHITELETNLKDKEDEIKTLSDEIRTVRERFDQMTVGHNALNQELETAKAGGSVVTSLILGESAVQTDEAELKSKIAELEAMLQTKDAEIESLSEEISKVSEVTDKIASEAEELKQKLKDVEEDNIKKLAECKSLAKELDAAKARESEMQSMTPVIEPTIFEPVKSELLASAPSSPGSDETGMLRRENEALASRNAKLEASLKDKVDEIEILGREMEVIQLQLQQKTADFDALNKELETIQARESVLMSLTPDESAVQAGEMGLKSEITDLKSSLRIKEDEIKNLENEALKLSDFSAELQQKLKELEGIHLQKVADCQSLQEQLNAVKSVDTIEPGMTEVLPSAPLSVERKTTSEFSREQQISRIAELESALTSKEYEIKTLKQNLCDKISKNSQLSEFEDIIKSLNDSLNAKNSEIDALKESLQENPEAKHLRRCLRSAEYDNYKYCEDIKQLVSELAYYEKELQKREKDINEFEARLINVSSKLFSKINDLSVIVDSGERRISDLMSVVDELNVKESDLRDEITKREVMEKRLRGQLDEEIVKSHKLVSDNTKLKTEKDELNRRCNMMADEMKCHSDEQKTLEDALKARETKQKSLEETLKAKNNEVEQLKQRLQALESANSHQTEEIDSLTQELNEVKAREQVSMIIEPSIVQATSAEPFQTAYPTDLRTDRDAQLARSNELEETDKKLEGFLEAKEKECQALQDALNTKENELKDKDNLLKSKESDLASLEESLQQISFRMDSLNRYIRDLEKENSSKSVELETALKEKEVLVQKLEDVQTTLIPSNQTMIETQHKDFCPKNLSPFYANIVEKVLLLSQFVQETADIVNISTTASFLAFPILGCSVFYLDAQLSSILSEIRSAMQTRASAGSAVEVSSGSRKDRFSPFVSVTSQVGSPISTIHESVDSSSISRGLLCVGACIQNQLESLLHQAFGSTSNDAEVKSVMSSWSGFFGKLQNLCHSTPMQLQEIPFTEMSCLCHLTPDEINPQLMSEIVLQQSTLSPSTQSLQGDYSSSTVLNKYYSQSEPDLDFSFDHNAQKRQVIHSLDRFSTVLSLYTGRGRKPGMYPLATFSNQLSKLRLGLVKETRLLPVVEQKPTMSFEVPSMELYLRRLLNIRDTEVLYLLSSLPGSSSLIDRSSAPNVLPSNECIEAQLRLLSNWDMVQPIDPSCIPLYRVKLPELSEIPQTSSNGHSESPVIEAERSSIPVLEGSQGSLLLNPDTAAEVRILLRKSWNILKEMVQIFKRPNRSKPLGTQADELLSTSLKLSRLLNGESEKESREFEAQAENISGGDFKKIPESPGLPYKFSKAPIQELIWAIDNLEDMEELRSLTHLLTQQYNAIGTTLEQQLNLNRDLRDRLREANNHLARIYLGISQGSQRLAVMTERLRIEAEKHEELSSACEEITSPSQESEPTKTDYGHKDQSRESQTTEPQASTSRKSERQKSSMLLRHLRHAMKPKTKK